MLFEKRSRRPPENRVNALLSFTYMLLKNDMQSALESAGLDPAAGYLHRGGGLFRTMGSAMVVSGCADYMGYPIVSARTLVS